MEDTSENSGNKKELTVSNLLKIVETIQDGNYDIDETLQDELQTAQNEINQAVKVFSHIIQRLSKLEISIAGKLPKKVLSSDQDISATWTFDSIKTGKFNIPLYTEYDFNPETINNTQIFISGANPSVKSISLSNVLSQIVLIKSNCPGFSLIVNYMSPTGIVVSVTLSYNPNLIFMFTRSSGSIWNNPTSLNI